MAKMEEYIAVETPFTMGEYSSVIFKIDVFKFVCTLYALLDFTKWIWIQSLGSRKE